MCSGGVLFSSRKKLISSDWGERSQEVGFAGSVGTGSVSFAAVWQACVSKLLPYSCVQLGYFIRPEEEAYFMGTLTATSVLHLLHFLG